MKKDCQTHISILRKNKKNNIECALSTLLKYLILKKYLIFFDLELLFRIILSFNKQNTKWSTKQFKLFI